MIPSCYKTLGVEPGASREEVKLAYRRLAAFYHPDRNPDDPRALERFRAVIDAYRQLLSEANALEANEKSLPPSVSNRRRNCRRKRRGTPSDRRYHWQLAEEYIGTNVQCEV